MKIMHVVDGMEVGGAETLVAQMCRVQRERGHDPSVYAIGNLGPIGESMKTEGFPVQANLGSGPLASSRRFFQIFREHRPDAVHLHNPTPTTYAAIAARMAAVPAIVSTRHSLVAPPRKTSLELRYAVAAQFCDWVAGVCDATTNNLRTMRTIPKRKLVRIYNGVAPLRRVAPELCPPRKGFTLACIARLAPVKNHTLLLRAFQMAVLSNPGLQLWMVGDGSERAMLENLARELGIAPHVTFWGQQLDVAPFFSAPDAFILSSISEGLPISLLQAFSAGLPAIVTDVGGMAEVVRATGAGIIVAVTDAGLMAEAILRMASNPAQRKQFASNAQTAFRSSFTIESMVDAYMDLYRITPRRRG